MGQKMGRDFFKREAEKVAEDLLGKVICRKTETEEIRLRIVEVEAYPAEDTACYGHKYIGKEKKSEAIKPLFEKAGTCCIYGGMILIVCGENGGPANALIRAAVGVEEFYIGPCRVADALKIESHKNNAGYFRKTDLIDDGILWIEDSPKQDIIKLKRKGLGKAVDKEDRKKPLRFVDAGSVKGTNE